MFLFIRVMRRENTYVASSMSNSSVVVCTRSQMFPSCAASWFKMCDLLQSPAISSDFSSATLSNFFKIFARAASFSSLKSFLQSLSSILLHSWPVCSRTEEMYPENKRNKGIRLPFRISLKNNNSLPSLLISGVGERMRSYLYFVFCSWLFCYKLVVQIRKIQKRMKKKNVIRGKNVSKF